MGINQCADLRRDIRPDVQFNHQPKIGRRAPKRAHALVCKRIEILFLAAMQMEAHGCKARLALHQRRQTLRGARHRRQQMRTSAQAHGLALQRIKHQVVIIAIRLWMNQHRPVDAARLHLGEIGGKRVGIQSRLIRGIGGPLVKRKARGVAAKQMMDPFNDHARYSRAHTSWRWRTAVL